MTSMTDAGRRLRLRSGVAALVAAVAVLVAGVAAVPAYAADTVTVDGMTFTPEDPDRPVGALLTSYSGPGGSVVIPGSVTIAGTEYAVTGIGIDAFREKGLTAVDIPSSVTRIGQGAFTLNQLTSLTIPTGVQRIGQVAFGGNKLTSLVLPSTLTRLDTGAFSNNLLTTVDIPASLTELPEAAFYNNLLSSVTLPATMTSIGQAAFRDNRLTSFTFPPLVSYVSPEVLAGNLFTSFTFPDTVRTISGGVLGNNPLTHVSLGGGVQLLEANAFSGVILPEGGLAPCLLTSVDFGTSLVEVESSAFLGCSLGAIELPDSLRVVSLVAFARSGLTHVDLGDGVQQLLPGAFMENALTSVTLPASLQMLSSGPFAKNPDLTSVTFLGPPPNVPYGNPLVESSTAAERVTVTHYWRFGADQVSGGFTSPSWYDSPTRSLAIVDFALGGHGADIAPVEVAPGGTVAAPATPSAAGWSFRGWFADAALTVPFDFDALVTRDLTAFAKWSAETSVAVGPDPDAVAVEGRELPVRAVVTTDAAAGVPAGSIRLLVDGAQLGELLPVDGSGAAEFSLPAMAAGDHTLGAAFVPADDRWLQADAAVPFTVSDVAGVTDAIEVRPSATQVDQGGSITFEVEAFDVNGDSLGEVTGDAVFSSSVAEDVVLGATVSFPHASVHTITAAYAGLLESVEITVIPEPEPEVDPAGGSTADDLATTGAADPVGGMLSGLLLLAAGLVVALAVRRRAV